MNYEVIFDTSADRNSTQRRFVTVPAARLAAKITSLQAQGRIIYEVRQAR
jgi:hypothetical protein